MVFCLGQIPRSGFPPRATNRDRSFLSWRISVGWAQYINVSRTKLPTVEVQRGRGVLCNSTSPLPSFLLCERRLRRLVSVSSLLEQGPPSSSVFVGGEAMATDATAVDVKKLTLKSSDGEVFEVEEAVAMESQTIRNLIEDECTADAIPLPNVAGRILAKVIEFCKKHVESAAKKGDESADRVVDDELKTWDADFVKVDQATLFDLILAANYLNIKSLLDLTCQTVADMIKGKTPEEIRKTFNIKNDFTPEEEEEVRRENQWAFE
ncbi:hypothetical protein Taro_036911 [Colocasia esculenta]|uniref:SKP1-like protein n=1 Tax=Colocasia esculenta TaxID=4460 RepID=A0A843WEQ7_COLES|nr:hypothetical protein [Colocasia esculenta]